MQAKVKDKMSRDSMYQTECLRLNRHSQALNRLLIFQLKCKLVGYANQ